MPVAVVGAVVAIGSAVVGFAQSSSAAQAQLITTRANIDAQNLTRQANNEYQAAATALSNYVRSANNNQLLKAAGENYNALGQNITRVLDDSVRGKLGTQMQASETLGAMAAAAGYAGVGGTTTEMLNSTFRRAQAFSEQAGEDSLNYTIGDMRNARANQISNAIAQMDQGTSFADQDFSRNTMPFIAKPSLLGAVANGIQGALPYIGQYMEGRAAAQAMAPKTSSPSAPATAFGYQAYSSGATIK